MTSALRTLPKAAQAAWHGRTAAHNIDFIDKAVARGWVNPRGTELREAAAWAWEHAVLAARAAREAVPELKAELKE